MVSLLKILAKTYLTLLLTSTENENFEDNISHLFIETQTKNQELY